jgi:ATP:ADP antiporter, AAA family
VFVIVLLVVFSQFIINLANYKFNIHLGQFYDDSKTKTVFLGKVYSSINGLALIVQIFFIPPILKYLHLRNVHLLLPAVYSIVFAFTFVFSAGPIAVAGLFIICKGLDYSLFAAAKEMLYFPLSERQKFGAKYIVDMISYRFSKGLISLVLLTFDGLKVVNGLLITFLTLWFLLLFPFFKLYGKIHGPTGESQ